MIKILDATTSVKGMWYQKDNPYTVFMDQRYEKLIMPFGKGRHDIININPDIIARWQNLPFKSSSFDMVVFDPPHIIRNKSIKQGPICMKYGMLYKHSWKEDMRSGFVELFRVLKENCILVLKWDECTMKVDEVLKLTPYKPLFGTRTGVKNNCHWINFIKYDNKQTSII